MLPLKGINNFYLFIPLDTKYFIIFSNVCECKSSEPHFNLRRSFSDCSTLCHENPAEHCGGRTTSSVYKTLYSGINIY